MPAGAAGVSNGTSQRYNSLWALSRPDGAPTCIGLRARPRTAAGASFGSYLAFERRSGSTLRGRLQQLWLLSSTPHVPPRQCVFFELLQERWPRADDRFGGLMQPSSLDRNQAGRRPRSPLGERMDVASMDGVGGNAGTKPASATAVAWLAELVEPQLFRWQKCCGGR